MSDGDIWGGGRLTKKWLAVGSQREDDHRRGVAPSPNLPDMVAHALAETFRRVNRRPCADVVQALLGHRNADTVSWQAILQRVEREWGGSSDAQMACRAAVAVRHAIPSDATDEDCELAYHASYATTACRHMESTVNARVGCEDADSALLTRHVEFFARQLMKGPEAKVRAPNRTVPKKDTAAILDMTIE